MTVKANPTTAAAKWASGVQNGAESYKAGVAAVTEAPGMAASNASALWLANTQAAVNRYKANSAAVSLGAWQTATSGYGATNFAASTTKGQPKVATFQAAFLPKLTNIVNSLPARGSYAQNKTRLVAYLDAVQATKGSY